MRCARPPSYTVHHTQSPAQRARSRRGAHQSFTAHTPSRFSHLGSRQVATLALFTHSRVILRSGLAPTTTRKTWCPLSISYGDLLPLVTNPEPPWLPNTEMTKLCEVSDETSTDRFPHFQCLTLQCDPSTLTLRLGGSGRVASGPRRG